jgi:hypothetical protein
MLSFSVSYWDLIKFHYFFANTTERGGIGGEREGDFKDNFNAWIFNSEIFDTEVIKRIIKITIIFKALDGSHFMLGECSMFQKN